ncbi:unnamed protein product [Prorocentrum cordatum]|uniref:Uncharacterized protein n=1 Tax=Prorocentrum cordatum TaxID=2364126 RepID=A0ABN9USW0_9DINO|nr:unnamed protein product [Polarella glacialis]
MPASAARTRAAAIKQLFCDFDIRGKFVGPWINQKWIVRLLLTKRCRLTVLVFCESTELGPGWYRRRCSRAAPSAARPGFSARARSPPRAGTVQANHDHVHGLRGALAGPDDVKDRRLDARRLNTIHDGSAGPLPLGHSLFLLDSCWGAPGKPAGQQVANAIVSRHAVPSRLARQGAVLVGFQNRSAKHHLSGMCFDSASAATALALVQASFGDARNHFHPRAHQVLLSVALSLGQRRLQAVGCADRSIVRHRSGFKSLRARSARGEKSLGAGGPKRRRNPRSSVEPRGDVRRLPPRLGRASRETAIPEGQTGLHPLPIGPVDAQEVIPGAAKHRVAGPDGHQVLQTFGHYAALADPLNRTSLSSLKFRRFLRDCGLLSSEARRRSASSSAGPLGGGEPRRCTEASLGGSAPGGLLRSGSLGPARRGSASLSVSRGGLASGLPLRVFGKALLTEVQADLLFVQARRSGSMGPARGGGGGAVARAPGKQLGVEGFRKLLQDLSQRCAPHLRPAGADPASSSLELFCGQVLGPLNQLLLEASGSEAAAAARTMESPEAVLLLRRARPGVERLFAAYASAAPGREPAWSVEATARFAEDFHVSQELGPLTVQRAFQDCIHHEGCRSGGSDAELSAATLELVLVLLAQKLHGSQQGATPLEKVLELFRLMNGIASSSGFAGRSWPPHEQLIPVPLARRASADSLTAAPRASRDAGDMTWADMLVGDEAP